MAVASADTGAWEATGAAGMFMPYQNGIRYHIQQHFLVFYSRLRGVRAYHAQSPTKSGQRKRNQAGKRNAPSAKADGFLRG
jgi:hypothetical protein